MKTMYAPISLALCMALSGASFATDVPREVNPPACQDHNYKTRGCPEWSYLVELQHPDAWEFSRRNRERRARWYGVQRPQAVVVSEQPRVIVLEGVNFDFDKSDLRPDAIPILRANAEDLRASKYMKIVVVGYTDSKGSDEYNQKLSERRANAVKEYFVSQGIDADRITVEGRGESGAVAANTLPNGEDNPEGRAKNRRAAELQVWSQK